MPGESKIADPGGPFYTGVAARAATSRQRARRTGRSRKMGRCPDHPRADTAAQGSGRGWSLPGANEWIAHSDERESSSTRTARTPQERGDTATIPAKFQSEATQRRSL